MAWTIAPPLSSVWTSNAATTFYYDAIALVDEAGVALVDEAGAILVMDDAVPADAWAGNTKPAGVWTTVF